MYFRFFFGLGQLCTSSYISSSSFSSLHCLHTTAFLAGRGAIMTGSLLSNIRVRDATNNEEVNEHFRYPEAPASTRRCDSMTCSTN